MEPTDQKIHKRNNGSLSMTRNHHYTLSMTQCQQNNFTQVLNLPSNNGSLMINSPDQNKTNVNFFNHTHSRQNSAILVMSSPQKHSIQCKSRAESIMSSGTNMNLIEGTSQLFNTNEKSTAQEQRQLWDALFDPQCTFNGFIHESNHPQDHEGFTISKKLDQLLDAGNPKLASTRPSLDVASPAANTVPRLPTLPKILAQINEKELDPEEMKFTDKRMKLFGEIRQNPFKELPQNGLKQQIVEKAKKLCQEVQEYPTPTYSTSTLSLELTDIEKSHRSKRCRRSFLCFVFGFLFPPLWLFGAFYIPSYDSQQTAANRRIDHNWRRRSRIAFGTFITFLMVVLVAIFVAKPGSVGWRQSTPIPIE